MYLIVPLVFGSGESIVLADLLLKSQNAPRKAITRNFNFLEHLNTDAPFS